LPRWKKKLELIKDRFVFRKSKKMHFIGIGGIGMSGIAGILIDLGYEVSGSDLRESETTMLLRKAGAEVFIGHYPSNIQDYHVVVTSSAIDPANPEIIEARKRNIPIIHRSEMLAELVRMKYGIGVAGTHGKTTTSSLLAYVLDQGGLNPTAVIGGKVFNFGSNARHGDGEYMVFEADESDGSFLKLLPTIGIVTNIDADHLDHYGYFEGLKDAFLQYMNSIPFYGYSAVCIDDPVIREMAPKIERPYVTYGLSEDAEVRAVNLRREDGHSKFDVVHNGDDLGVFTLGLLGHHNVVNSLAVLTVAHELGIGMEEIRDSLSSFRGVGRRMELVGEENGVTVYDDYGHHPTEIQATVSAIAGLNKRVLVVFQPHRYSRTKLLWDEFGQSFTRADRVLVTNIYPAGEKPIEGVDSSLIIESIKRHEDRDAVLVERFEDVVPMVLEEAREGDVVLTLGAGDIYRVGPMILEGLKEKR
jgi:UDP-N-acetylmuramate--alanine ligase